MFTIHTAIVSKYRMLNDTEAWGADVEHAADQTGGASLWDIKHTLRPVVTPRVLLAVSMDVFLMFLTITLFDSSAVQGYKHPHV